MPVRAGIMGVPSAPLGWLSRRKNRADLTILVNHFGETQWTFSPFGWEICQISDNMSLSMRIILIRMARRVRLSSEVACLGAEALAAVRSPGRKSDDRGQKRAISASVDVRE